MAGSSTIPGYLTLSEAEEFYNIKADTLKKRCQRGEIVGARMIGKTWIVPNIPNIDPEKTIPENYPTLNFDAALSSNLSLYDAESDSRSALYSSHRQAIYIWEYGFYFFSLIFRHSNLHRSYLPLAALITEAHTALRAAFLINLDGYHPDAFALLRKAHECTIKAIAMKTQPKKFWQIGFSTSRQVSEHKIGVDFSKAWTLESSFNHSNLMKLYKAGKDINNPDIKASVSYGPQIDNKEFRAAINTSIFWLYVLTRSLSYIFADQISDKWLQQQKESAKLLKDHLTVNKSYKNEIASFEKAIIQLESKKST
jgi:hypothetical protein